MRTLHLRLYMFLLLLLLLLLVSLNAFQPSRLLSSSSRHHQHRHRHRGGGGTRSCGGAAACSCGINKKNLPLLAGVRRWLSASSANEEEVAAAAFEYDKNSILSLRLKRHLDEAVLLYHRLDRYNNCHHQGTTSSITTVSSLDWLQDQLFSLIECLAGLVQSQPEENDFVTTNANPQTIALELDKALVARSESRVIENLVQRYRRAKQWSSMSTTLPAKLDAVQRQLEAFGLLLDSLLLQTNGSSKTNTTTTSSAGGSVSAQRASSSTTALLASRSDTAMNDMDVTSTVGDDEDGDSSDGDDEVVVDVAIIGAGIAGLCAGAILNKLHGKKVGVYESHYLAGGCAHAFDRRVAVSSQSKNNDNNNGGEAVTFTFDSGPTILLGCSSPPYNALRQVLNAIAGDDDSEQQVEWIPYDGWGMIENPGNKDTEVLRWRVELGPSLFEEGPLQKFGGPNAVKEFRALRRATKDLLAGVEIPAMAMRPGAQALFPLLRYFPTLVKLISQGELVTGTFAPFMDGPRFLVTDPWLRNWLDALAFSLSGLPASRTAAAAMAFVLYDMHRPGAALDYPKGGMGSIIEALVRGVEAGDTGSKVHLRQHVERINCSEDASRITGLTLRNGKTIRARQGVICNAPVWSLRNLIRDERVLKRLLGTKDNDSSLSSSPSIGTAPSSWTVTEDGASVETMTRAPPESKGSVLFQCDSAEQTGSFLHLHLALNATGLDLDRLEAHYTVMDRGLSGDGSVTNGVADGPCGELNMIAVSNPCVIDRSLAPEGYIVVHAYGAGNEPYELWQGLDRSSKEYQQLKEERAQVLWRAVESVIPDVRERVVLALIGSPLTHERFLRRPRGTYGSATEDYLRDGSTDYDSLVLANDGVFPGVGVPSVCIAGASAANAFVPVLQQWHCLDRLQREGKI